MRKLPPRGKSAQGSVGGRVSSMMSVQEQLKQEREQKMKRLAEQKKLLETKKVSVTRNPMMGL